METERGESSGPGTTSMRDDIGLRRRQLAHEPDASSGTRAYSPFVPLLLLTVTLLVMVAFQTVQLSRERDTLVKLRENQEAPLAESGKVRAQLESIAKGTAQLAAEGNANARAIVGQLRQLGVTINLDGESAKK